MHYGKEDADSIFFTQSHFGNIRFLLFLLKNIAFDILSASLIHLHDIFKYSLN